MMANHEGSRALQQDPPEYGSIPPGLNEPAVNKIDKNKIDEIPQATVDLAEQVAAGITQNPVKRVNIDEIKSGATVEDDELDQEEIATEDMVTDKMTTQTIVTEDDVIELGQSGHAVDDEIQTAVRARADQHQPEYVPTQSVKTQPSIQVPHVFADRPVVTPPVTPPVPSQPVEPSLQTKIDTFDQRIRELEQQLNDTSGWRLLRRANLRRDLASLQKHKARYFQTYPELQRAAAAAERLREHAQSAGQERVVQLRDAITGVLERRAYTVSDPAELTDEQINALNTQILADRERLLSQQPSRWAPITQQRTWEANFQRLENRRRVYAAAQHARRESARTIRTRTTAA